MKLTIDYTGQLTSLLGVSEEILDVSEADTLGDVLRACLAVHGEAFGNLVFNTEGRISPTLLIALDGEQAVGERDNLSLEGVRAIMLITPISGG